MVPYQVYEVLSAQRNRELEARARRYEQRSSAQFALTGTTRPTSRFKGAVARIVGLVHVRSDARAGSTTTSASGAGPMGCAA